MNLDTTKYYFFIIPSENRKYGIYCDSGVWQEFRFTTDADWDFGKFTTPEKWIRKAEQFHRKIHSGVMN